MQRQEKKGSTCSDKKRKEVHAATRKERKYIQRQEKKGSTATRKERKCMQRQERKALRQERRHIDKKEGTGTSAGDRGGDLLVSLHLAFMFFKKLLRPPAFVGVIEREFERIQRAFLA
jgi:hypothetical protein